MVDMHKDDPLAGEIRLPWGLAIPIALAFVAWVVTQPFVGRTRILLLLVGVGFLLSALVRGVKRLFVRYDSYLGPTIGIYALFVGSYVFVTGSPSEPMTIVLVPLCAVIALGAGADALWGQAAQPFTLGLLGGYLVLVSAYAASRLGPLYAVPTGIVAVLSLRDAVRHYRARSTDGTASD